LGWLRSRFPIDDDEADWLLACFAWMRREFDPRRASAVPLVLPDPTFFPRSVAQGHDRATELFDQVKAHAGMTEWPCDLVVGSADRERVLIPGFALRHDSKPAPLGTFGYRDGHYVISYNPGELAYPQSLIATFAHELAHYLMHSAQTSPPGGPDLLEHATDATAVYLGFGIFMANSSKNFSQFHNFDVMGWEMRPQGYLSELALVTALAIFGRLRAVDPDKTAGALKDYLRKPYRKAAATLEKRYPDLAAHIDAIDLGDWR
jgi:hypothetical protein